MVRRFVLGVGLTVAVAAMSFAQDRDVVSGQTSVLLDVQLLSDAAGLDLSSVSMDVGTGELGKASVAFDINSRDAMPLATTFSYTAGTLAPFEGAIEHTGSVFFNDDMVEVGNFTIGFDDTRVGGANSGFFVESTTGVEAILFDVANVSNLLAGDLSLSLDADLVVSPEFAGFLGNAGLTGADVGDARVSAVSVPEPTSLGVIVAFGLITLRRRSRS